MYIMAAKYLLKIGSELYKCDTVSEIPIEFEIDWKKEVHGYDYMKFDVVCDECSDELNDDFVQARRYKFAQVCEFVEWCNGDEGRRVPIFTGYTYKVVPCSKTKAYTYKFELRNYKWLLDEQQIWGDIKVTRTIFEIIAASSTEYQWLVTQMNSCGVPLTYCNSEFFDNTVTINAECEDSVYDVIQSMADQHNLIWYINTICDWDNVRIVIYFTDCLGEDKTDDPNSQLIYDWKDKENNTIDSFCIDPSGGWVSCVVARVLIDVQIGTDWDWNPIFEEQPRYVSQSKWSAWLVRCLQVDNNGSITVDNFVDILRPLAQAELDIACKELRRYSLDTTKNPIDANIWDEIQLEITNTKPDLDTNQTLTVISICTKYIDCDKIETIKVSSPELPYISIRQIKKNLASIQ